MIRKIRNWVITAAFILGGTTVAMAQAKIAHIDSQKLLKEMPEMKKAQAELQKVEQSYTNDIQASIKDLCARFGVTSGESRECCPMITIIYLIFYGTTIKVRTRQLY